MSNIFSFEFEELPLVIHNGIEAAFINGAVEVEYDCNGYWNNGYVTVEGFGNRIDGKRQWPQVPAPAVLATIIVQRLEKEWAHKVQDAVRERLASDHEAALEERADMRRDEKMGL
jgi:hypothetical protein